MQKKSLNMYSIIPHHLWHDVDVIIDYVTTYPFLTPTNCKHCGSDNFRLSYYVQKNKNNITNYYCFCCKRKFNQTTNTLFARIKLELWPEFAIRRILGLSTTQIVKELPLSLKVCVSRSKILEYFMTELTPELYKWWKPRQDYQEHKMPIQVDVEYQRIQHCLNTIIGTDKAPCPHCKNKNVSRVKTGKADEQGIRHRHRPYFYCGRCKHYFNLFDNSPLKKLNKIDKWLPFLQAIVEGTSNYQIAEQLHISQSSVLGWRQCFIKQMQIMHLTNLIHWIDWRRSRSIAYRTKKVKEQCSKKSKHRQV